MSSTSMRAKIIRVKIEADGDMFFATSPDMKGLLVAATSREKMDAAVSEAIRGMYLACGIEVLASKAEEAEDFLEPWVAFPVELARRAVA